MRDAEDFVTGDSFLVCERAAAELRSVRQTKNVYFIEKESYNTGPKMS